MSIMKTVPAVFFLPLLFAMGCSNNANVVTNGIAPDDSNALPPFLQQIGTDAIITFDPSGEQGISIPIRGQSLNDPSLAWTVDIQGVAPISLGSDDQKDVDVTFGDSAPQGTSLNFPGSYFKKCKSGDILTVSVAVSGQTPETKEQERAVRAAIAPLENGGLSSSAEKLLTDLEENFAEVDGFKRGTPPSTMPDVSVPSNEAVILASLRKLASSLPVSDPSDKFKKAIECLANFWVYPSPYAPVGSFATRRFVLYDIDTYRTDYLKNRVPIADIDAFPLSTDETQKLFGPVVDDDYFAVRVSFRNTTSQDILVSTGMIKVFGQASVTIQSNQFPSYTIPVEVMPQSREQVYSVVSDNKPDQPREVFFRSLEFTGALATAISAGFGGAPDLIKGISVFTGVGIPEGEKLFPDPVPAYLKNLVDYSMPDLVKVPKQTTIDHKYLFFS
jgi:hypothetical protein